MWTIHTIKYYSALKIRKSHHMLQHGWNLRTFLLFGCPVMSNSLWPHGLQHVRPPHLSQSPRVCPGACPLYQWCHPSISSSDILFSCSQSFPASGTFPMSQLFASGDQILELQLQHQYFQLSIQGWFPLRLTGLISLLSKGFSRIFSSTTVRRHRLPGARPSLRSSSDNYTRPLGRS